MIVATMGGIAGGGRFCAMFNSIAQGRYAVESPGEQLIVNLVRGCCERGFDTFDLGIGEAHYKSLFCGDAEPLFDSYLPLTAGAAACWRSDSRLAARRQARRSSSSQLLWSLVRWRAVRRAARARYRIANASKLVQADRRLRGAGQSAPTSAKPAIVSRSHALRAVRVAGLAGSALTSTARCASGAKRSTAMSAAEPTSITT